MLCRNSVKLLPEKATWLPEPLDSLISKTKLSQKTGSWVFAVGEESYKMG